MASVLTNGNGGNQGCGEPGQLSRVSAIVLAVAAVSVTFPPMDDDALRKSALVAQLIEESRHPLAGD
jgi:hypothetical protein